MMIHQPIGFEDWLIHLESMADEGTPALQIAWNMSPFAFRTFLMETQSAKWQTIQTKAAHISTAIMGRHLRWTALGYPDGTAFEIYQLLRHLEAQRRMEAQYGASTITSHRPS